MVREKEEKMCPLLVELKKLSSSYQIDTPKPFIDMN